MPSRLDGLTKGSVAR